jgi:transposase-like protein
MSTRKPRDAAKERYWRRVVRHWRHSKLSVRAFCRQQGLQESNFYAWRRTLRQRDALDAAFVPVQVVAEPHGHGRSPAVELVLANGRLLRLGPGFDAATLQRLLTLLEEGRPC